MNLFYTIIEKYCMKNEETRFLVLYNGYERKMETKFRAMLDIQNNLFIMPKVKELISDLFYKAQRSYYALSRFARIYLVHKAKMPIEHDLYLNPIDKTYRKSIQLYDRSHKSLYYFTSSDLVRIINTALTNSRNYFIEPLECKNPYTNTPFTKSMLYSIYFHIQKTYSIIPPLLQALFMDNFDYELFAIHNEQMIRNMCVDSFLKNSSTEVLYNEVMNMFALVKHITNISDEFPKNILVDVMRPYLYLYCRYMYSNQGTEQRYIYYTILRRKIMEFDDYNPHFGRKIITRSTNGNRKIKIHFNSECPQLTIQNINDIISKKIYRFWYLYGWTIPSDYTAAAAGYSARYSSISSSSLYRTDVDSDPEGDIIYPDPIERLEPQYPYNTSLDNTNTTIDNTDNMNNTNTHNMNNESSSSSSSSSPSPSISSESESEEMDFDY